MKSQPNIHLLIRFSDTLIKTGDTISAHNAVVSQAGAVWFGKMGSTIRQEAFDRLNQQVENGISTYIYLVKGNRRKSTAYRAHLIQAAKIVPEAERGMIPAYYQELDLIKYMKAWVKLGEIQPISGSELDQLKVASSVLPIHETLKRSSTGHFVLVNKI